MSSQHSSCMRCTAANTVCRGICRHAREPVRQPQWLHPSRLDIALKAYSLAYIYQSSVAGCPTPYIRVYYVQQLINDHGGACNAVNTVRTHAPVFPSLAILRGLPMRVVDPLQQSKGRGQRTNPHVGRPPAAARPLRRRPSPQATGPAQVRAALCRLLCSCGVLPYFWRARTATADANKKASLPVRSTTRGDASTWLQQRV